MREITIDNKEKTILEHSNNQITVLNCASFMNEGTTPIKYGVDELTDANEGETVQPGRGAIFSYAHKIYFKGVQGLKLQVRAEVL